MKKLFTVCFLMFAFCANAHAAARVAVNRVSTNAQSARTATTTPAPTTRTISSRSATTTARTATPSVSARNATTSVSARRTNPQSPVPSPRTARSATTARSAQLRNQQSAVRNTSRAARAATAAASVAFSGGYNACRDSYFTCMDQFCATANDTYRRCVCSSRLEEMMAQQRALNRTEESLQNFQDLNMDAIGKTASEVSAMLSATTGESAAANAKDTSASAAALGGISAVLNKTRTDSLSTSGRLDIAGDINAIWATTSLTGGADIMNLTGEPLYNAVHAQCIEFAGTSCESKSVSDMVVSAYGMYIENDCATLARDLNKKTDAANDSIRATERDMNLARLENYNVHNSVAVNECIANVRVDITSDMACGEGYVHCLDTTGKYLDRDTGEPIYSANFYQLETLTSVAGNILENPTNRALVAELERKKEFAKTNLDKCRDLEPDVWDEFLRQAIVEIYQGQQQRITQVKGECVDVVNQCYDTQSKSLRDFSNIKEQNILGQRLELAEQMCVEKLDACSNLYGGGATGLAELLITMQSITDQKIAKDCLATLTDYAKDICDVPTSDTVHDYPYSCRTYAPGDSQWAAVPGCNMSSDFSVYNPKLTVPKSDLDSCSATVKYQSCSMGYYLAFTSDKDYEKKCLNNKTPGEGLSDFCFNPEPKAGNKCIPCPNGYSCPGGLNPPELNPATANCGEYSGSLYQKIARYALETCVRPNSGTSTLPANILGDVNTVMDKIKIDMAKQLSAQCERDGGIWSDTPCEKDNKVDPCQISIDTNYAKINASPMWGYCLNSYGYFTCPKNSDIDRSCTSISSNNTPDGCVSINCRCKPDLMNDETIGCTEVCPPDSVPDLECIDTNSNYWETNDCVIYHCRCDSSSALVNGKCIFIP